MILAAAKAPADFVSDDELTGNRIIPGTFGDKAASAADEAVRATAGAQAAPNPLGGR